MDFEGCEAEDGGDDTGAAGLTRVVRVLVVAEEEGGDVGTCLADDEVVYVEEFGDSTQWGVSLVGRVGCCFPGLKCNGVRGGGGEPGDYAARFVFAEETVRAVEVAGVGVGGDGRGPD